MEKVALVFYTMSYIPFNVKEFQYITFPSKQCMTSLIKGSSSHQRCSLKKGFLEISQNSQENNCARVSFLIKLQAGQASLSLQLN